MYSRFDERPEVKKIVASLLFFPLKHPKAFVTLVFLLLLTVMAVKVNNTYQTYKKHPALFFADIEWLWRPIVHRIIYESGRFISIPIDPEKTVFQFMLDVSGDMEFTYLYKHMLAHKSVDLSKPSSQLVVDIGAHDCVTQSNSYNFLQMGWSGVLVEAGPKKYEMCQQTLRSIVSARTARVSLINAAVRANSDEPITFYEAKFGSGFEDTTEELDPSDIASSYTVQGISINSLIKRYQIESVTLLSIDIEKSSCSDILAAFISNNIYPKYIVIEGSEDVLINAGYTVLGGLKYNTIYYYNK
eukprot:TRINITY_DN388_c5_g1_i2.p1 TRINITY_DN388_c5_g1~~TRINITY_DN388_c5_g1_i2.p1  ORF type:complete len:301 (-),score=34.00 TRINITY_DN388_c5_g1_i2:46-948(-)